MHSNTIAPSPHLSGANVTDTCPGPGPRPRPSTLHSLPLASPRPPPRAHMSSVCAAATPVTSRRRVPYVSPKFCISCASSYVRKNSRLESLIDCPLLERRTCWGSARARGVRQRSPKTPQGCRGISADSHAGSRGRSRSEREQCSSKTPCSLRPIGSCRVPSALVVFLPPPRSPSSCSPSPPPYSFLAPCLRLPDKLRPPFPLSFFVSPFSSSLPLLPLPPIKLSGAPGPHTA
eukprot:50952-Hanusia_phi.AAC.2